MPSHDDGRAAWAAAFVSAQSEMPDIPKSKRAKITTKSGRDYEYEYASLPDIIDRVRPILAKHQLGFAQSVEPNEYGIAVLTRVYHVMGHVESFGPVVLPAGDDARSIGSAITYARRYALCAVLGIAADEDDDAALAPRKKRAAHKKSEPSLAVDSATVGAGDGQSLLGEGRDSSDPAPDQLAELRNKVLIRFDHKPSQVEAAWRDMTGEDRSWTSMTEVELKELSG